MSRQSNTNKKGCPVCGDLFSPNVYNRHLQKCEREARDLKTTQEFQRKATHTLNFASEFNTLNARSRVTEESQMPSGLDPGWPEGNESGLNNFDHEPDPSECDELHPDDIKIEFHPKSGMGCETMHFEDYDRSDHQSNLTPPDSTPWKPWRSRIDFEIASLALESHMTRKQTNKLFSILKRANGPSLSSEFTLKDYDEMQDLWDLAATRSTNFEKDVVSVPYRNETEEYELLYRPIWDWLQELLLNPDIVSRMQWDARRLYKYDVASGTWKHFIEEAWSAESWWSVQEKLPQGAKPLCIIFYADKNKLSSFGTAKGYPVIVRCANLPMDIRNGAGTAGGRVVGWLPIITEDAAHSGKAGYADFKNIVWHK
ncbi:hypothetical protein EV360DRAFT_66284 [Lentinula raphanica]|nr:hypothetical protein EV360DRAFT_66284 [Lentinula raphanica]